MKFAGSLDRSPVVGLSMILCLLVPAGCSDYGIRAGDSPQIIALKKMGAKVTTMMTGGVVIDLKDCSVDDDDLIYFEELPDVMSVNLSGTHISDEGLQHLAVGPKNLGELFLEQTDVTDAGFSQLKELSGLTLLSLSGTQITDEALAMLPTNHPKIRDLKLIDCSQITDAGMKSIAELRGLQNLFLANCTQITDEGLKHLDGKRGMKLIQLLNTGCTSGGVESLASSTGAPIVVNAEGKAAGAFAKMVQQ